MDALEQLLRPALAILNRQIPERTRARELCRALDGRSAAIRVRDTGLTACVTVEEELIRLCALPEDGPDVAISGSLLTLAALLRGRGEAAVRDGRLTLDGDAAVARDFQQLFAHARPDLEEALSKVVGDTAAHGVGEFLRGAQRWARDARATMGANLREYLTEERRDLPSRYEVERFADDVQTLRDDVARLEARLQRLAEGERP